MKKIELYNGDCLEVMDKLIEQGIKVDAIICDPPYGMSFRSNYRKKKFDKIKNDDNLEWLESFIELSYNVLNDNSPIYIFCSFHNVDKFKMAVESKFKLKNIIIWEKNNTGMGDLKGSYAPKYEMIIYATKGRVVMTDKRFPDIVKFKRTGNKFHPTEKPVDLMKFLINNHNDKKTILDPFMGSGTTGIACKELDVDFIGIELDSEYFEIARERIGEK